jgi:hypothetical protein
VVVPSRQPFTPLAAMLLTKARWKDKNTTRTGIVMIVE